MVNNTIQLLSPQKYLEFPLMKSTPVGLIYVADFGKLKGYVGTDDQRKWFVSGTETGFISQNVYLYCAAANLSTAIIGLVDRENSNS